MTEHIRDEMTVTVFFQKTKKKLGEHWRLGGILDLNLYKHPKVETD